MGALYRTHALAQENKRENRRGSKERALDNQLSLRDLAPLVVGRDIISLMA